MFHDGFSLRSFHLSETLTYKAYYSYLPSNVQRLFTRRKIAYSMRASHDLERQSVCSTMRAMSLCVKEVQVWNYLCDDLNIVNTVAAFKRKCKNFYLRNI